MKSRAYDVIQVLKKARQKIEQKWHQGAYSRDEAGTILYGDEAGATCWCALGALQAGAESHSSALYYDAYAAVEKTLNRLHGLTAIPHFNDKPSTSQRAVLELFDAAIRDVEEEYEPQLVADILKSARTNVERGWTQVYSARDAEGNSVSPVNPSATCFCALGALDKAYSVAAYRQPAMGYLNASIPADADLPKSDPDLNSLPTAQYNDLPTTTQQDVLALYDRAIAKAEAHALQAQGS